MWVGKLVTGSAPNYEDTRLFLVIFDDVVSFVLCGHRPFMVLRREKKILSKIAPIASDEGDGVVKVLGFSDVLRKFGKSRGLVLSRAFGTELGTVSDMDVDRTFHLGMRLLNILRKVHQVRKL